MEGFCRGCLVKYNEPMELLQYTEKNRRMFVYSTGLQVKRNDAFTFQLCKDCFQNMKLACKFKKQCRTSDKRFKNYMNLKDVGDPTDFCTFLKNSDETLSFRLPIISGNSTPANQKCRDDDNESTCTSIRNFMTDILQGEEMPDTEARIIKEVIEEEADVLDDSLDSHWLQDDMSIDTDLRLDFSFSPFSTPHSINNDHCYTPKKYVDQKEEQVDFYTVNSEKQTEILKEFTNNFKSDNEICNEINVAEKSIDHASSNVKELCNIGIDEVDGIDKSVVKSINKELCDFNLDDLDSIGKTDSNTLKDKALKELCDLSLNSIDDLSKDTFKIQSVKEDLCDFNIDVIDGMDQSTSNISLPSIPIIETDQINQNLFTPKEVIEPMQPNDISNTSINIEALLKDKPCSIDRNLEKALKDTETKEFSLDDLLVSPAYQTSAASTPTIANILFGEKLDTDANDVVPKIEQNISKYVANNDIEIFEELFDSTQAIDFEVINKENIAMKQQDTGLDDKENETKNNPMDISISDKNQAISNDEAKTIKTTKDFEKEYDLEKIYCNLCKKNYKSLRALGIHFSRTHNTKIVRPKLKLNKNKSRLCNLCGKEIALSNFAKHAKICEKPDQVFECNICMAQVASQAFLDRHISRNHTKNYVKKDNGKRYLCKICGIVMNKQSNLTIHLKRHSKNYSCKCSECGRGFYTSAELKNHMRQHTGDTPFLCKFCGRLFSRRDVLTRHIHSHLSKPKFYCDYCGMWFAKKNNLIKHITKEICKNKQSRIDSSDTKIIPEEKKDEVTVIYATGDDAAIRKQLSFIEAEMSR